MMATPPRCVALPPGWGEDSLSDFLDQAQSQTRKIFFQLAPVWRPAAELDERLRVLVRDYDEPLELSAGLFFKARNSFRAAAVLALAGFQVPTFTLLRNSLECALLGFVLARVPALRERWRRMTELEGTARRRAWHKDFAPRQLLSHLEPADDALARRWAAANDAAIRNGAHPSYEAWERSRVVEEEDDSHRKVTFVSLSGDRALIEECFRAVVECGQIALDLWRAAMSPARTA